MGSYWYSTDGLDQKRLSTVYLDILDRAYERRTRVEIFDDQTFGPHVAAVADPFLGTMTAGDIHYGLYRNPTLRRASGSSSSIDTLILFESAADIFQLQQPSVTPSSSLPISPNFSIGKSDDCVLVASHHLQGGRRSSSRSSILPLPSSMTTTVVGHQQQAHWTSPSESQEECTCCTIS